MFDIDSATINCVQVPRECVFLSTWSVFLPYELLLPIVVISLKIFSRRIFSYVKSGYTLNFNTLSV